MFELNEEQIAQFGLTWGVGGLIALMLFIIWNVARESKAGRFGTFVLFFVLLVFFVVLLRALRALCGSALGGSALCGSSPSSSSFPLPRTAALGGTSGSRFGPPIVAPSVAPPKRQCLFARAGWGRGAAASSAHWQRLYLTHAAPGTYLVDQGPTSLLTRNVRRHLAAGSATCPPPDTFRHGSVLCPAAAHCQATRQCLESQ